MAIPDEPLTRSEQYLNRTATGGGTIPDEPLTRVEQYLAKIAGQDVAIPNVPLTRLEQYLAAIAENGGGSSITVEPLTVTQNGTFSALLGKAYSPVTVNVPQPSGTKNITISQNGTTAEDVTNYENASITVNVQPGIVYNNGGNTMLSNPFSELDFDELYANIDTRKVFGSLWFEFNSMTIQVELYARNNIIVGMAFKSQPSPVGVLCEWNASGVVTLDALMNGQVQDMRAYAPRLTAHMYLFGTAAPTPAD